jgi:hypothetical protein
MTAQEIFDTSVGALLKQGRPAYSPEDGCAYRTPDGAKCAVGHLIPDSKYTPALEGMPADADDVLRAISEGAGDHAHLLQRLQSAHDAPAGGQNWLAVFKLNAREVAEDFNLSPAILDQVPA